MPKTLDQSTLPWEAQEVAYWLTEGNPTLGWRGDPRLWLQYSILTAGKSGFDPKVHRYVQKGDVVAKCYEVWRHTELGSDERILQVTLDRVLDIIPRLIDMDPNTPNQRPLWDRVIEENDRHDTENTQHIQEAHGEMAEHFWKLIADREHGKTTFRGMPGSNPDRQM